MIYKNIIYSVFLTWFHVSLFAALPLINSYNHASYHGGAENWDIVQTPNHYVYVANEKGVLQFDGRNWSLIRTPQQVRSLCLLGDSLLYVGCDNDLGTVNLKPNTPKVFKSIKKWLNNKGIGFIDEVWTIAFFENKIIAQTPSSLLIIDDGRVVRHPVTCFVRAMYPVGEQLYVVDLTKGLLEFKNNDLKEVVNGDFFKGDEINAILPFSDGSLLISSWSKGLFKYTDRDIKPWGGESSNKVWKSYVFSAKKSGAEFYFGTTEDGVYVVSETGEILSHLNENSGLTSNKVFNLYVDTQKSIWVALENGVEHVAMNAPVSIIDSKLGLNGACYSASIFNNELFVSTSQGLFVGDVNVLSLFSGEKYTMHILSDIKGPVHFMEKWKGKYFYGHLTGLFLGNNTQEFTNVLRGRNCIDMLPLSENGNYFLVAFEDEVVLSKIENEIVKNVYEIETLKGVERMVLGTKGVWLNTRYDGVSKLLLDTLNPALSSIEQYDEKKGLYSERNNHVFKISKNILCATDSGICVYDANKRIFQKSEQYHDFNNTIVDYLYEDKKGGVWYQKGELSESNQFLEFSCGVLSPNGRDRVRLKGEYVEFISQLNDSLMVFGGYDGLQILNLKIDESKCSSEVVLYKIELFSGTKSDVLSYDFVKNKFIGEHGTFESNEIPAKYNQIKFYFGNTLMHDVHKNEFSYKLEGLEDEWSSWTPRLEKVYNYLPSRELVFRLKSENAFGIESEEIVFSFELKKPFYSTGWFYALGVFFFVLISLSVFFVANRQNKQKRVN